MDSSNSNAGSGWNGAPAGEPETNRSDDNLAADVVVRQLQQQVAEANDRALRAQAELENFRKRSRREMEDERRYASIHLLREILNVSDNLQRAISSADHGNTTQGLLEGVKLVSIMLQRCLEQHDCKPIATLGTAFDPNLHEAIAQEPSTSVEIGGVTRETRSGYTLHDRVVRPAQVMVSTGPTVAATPNANS